LLQTQAGYERPLRDGCTLDGKRANRAATGTTHFHHLSGVLSAKTVKGPRPGAQKRLSTNRDTLN